MPHPPTMPSSTHHGLSFARHSQGIRWAASAAVLALATLLGACASKSAPSTGSSTARADQTAAPSQTATALPSMHVPAQAQKRLVLNMQLHPKHPQDSGWMTFKQEWLAIAKERAEQSGMTFAAQDGEPKGTGEAGTLVVMRIDDYKHVSVGARVMLGLMVGNAFIQGQADFHNLATGQGLGLRKYDSSSSASHGVFGAATPAQIDGLVAAIIAEVKRP